MQKGLERTQDHSAISDKAGVCSQALDIWPAESRRVHLGASLLKAGTLDARRQVSCRQEVRRAERRAAGAPGAFLLSRIQSK